MADLLNIDKFISDHKAKEVTTPKMFIVDKKSKEIYPDPKGIFSIDLFGPLHTKIRNETWGYFNLGTEIVHPAAFIILDKISPAFRKILLKHQKYSIKNGQLVSDPDDGKWGVSFFKKILKDLDWKAIPNYEDKKQLIDKIRQSKTLFIDKYIIEPPGYRDYHIRDGRPVYDDVNDLYVKALQTTKGSGEMSQSLMGYLVGSSESDGIDKSTVIQKQVLDIHNYFFERLRKKSGLVAGSMIKKRTDFVARLVASALPQVPPTSAIIPWGALINLFAPLVIHYIENDPDAIKLFSSKSTSHMSLYEYSSNFQYIFKNMDTVSKAQPDLKSKLIEILKKIISENDVMVNIKRDPAFSHTNHFAVYPSINTADEYTVIVNSMMYAPIGGDSIECRAVFVYDSSYRTSLNVNYQIQFPNSTASLAPMATHFMRLQGHR